ncbi:hypothetical protein [Aneurinibacillus thermoaerophilus]|uniref:Thiolase, N-terminal domain n=1 Tax=Aneurinibacillus thermoaerophilus TaxID=143495 RepID=A0A1G7X6R6_ANETH|nr:hypothetical protein [Aneurinibacillus thermoaerophilus]MED0674373.1 hypothetical protein [Aneurinibacillus thermoaerophilus]MED0678393.1 hypothetical protein [Aneurinibacillus thermoaerophilus]MED0736083.1 hypothetical protein [Aneurinibacillus thermoaerophilus]MED0765580.1 hypothetical protein [Aneurinibacillus thermoaerophilus]QYY44242.1 hypothetical protein K3F53_08730 [Aneurinibacillus thermoaerophilus]
MIRCKSYFYRPVFLKEIIVERAGIAVDWLDEVILGNVFQSGGKGNLAWQATLKAGIPETVPAKQKASRQSE